MRLRPVYIGSFGVGLLLAAFTANLTGYLNESDPTYLLANFMGALLAAWYAFKSKLIPFVILELVWSGVALYRLLRVLLA